MEKASTALVPGWRAAAGHRIHPCHYPHQKHPRKREIQIEIKKSGTYKGGILDKDFR